MLKRNVLSLFIIISTLVTYMPMHANEDHALTWHTCTQPLHEHTIFDTCMDLWSTVDLIHAINADPHVKNNSMHLIYNSMMMLARKSHATKRVVQRSLAFELISVINSLKEAFIRVFYECDSEIFRESLLLLDGLIVDLARSNENVEEIPISDMQYDSET